MRVLFVVLCVLLFCAYVGFVVLNPEARIAVTVWSGVQYADVPLYLIVALSVAIGMVFVSIVALAEGLSSRLQSRRLTREVQRLENELNYLRTQPMGRGSTREPEERSVESRAALPAPASDDPSSEALPSAPVYRPEDVDDDTYSGGSAV